MKMKNLVLISIVSLFISCTTSKEITTATPKLENRVIHDICIPYISNDSVEFMVVLTYVGEHEVLDKIPLKRINKKVQKYYSRFSYKQLFKSFYSLDVIQGSSSLLKEEFKKRDVELSTIGFVLYDK